jgi:hypothetical protein
MDAEESILFIDQTRQYCSMFEKTLVLQQNHDERIVCLYTN